MKDTLTQSNFPFINQCLDILKRDDIKKEFKLIFKPVIDYVLYEINPYIYIILLLVFLIFVMILAILVILIFFIRNKQIISKIFSEVK